MTGLNKEHYHHSPRPHGPLPYFVPPFRKKNYPKFSSSFSYFFYSFTTNLSTNNAQCSFVCLGTLCNENKMITYFTNLFCLVNIILLIFIHVSVCAVIYAYFTTLQYPFDLLYL